MAVTQGYIASQQKRYTDALKANDKTLIGKLEADAKRVGYTLPTPKATPLVSAVKPTGSTITNTAVGGSPATVDKLKADATVANQKLSTTPWKETFVNAVTQPQQPQAQMPAQTQAQPQASTYDAFKKATGQGVTSEVKQALSPAPTTTATSLPSNSIFNTPVTPVAPAKQVQVAPNYPMISQVDNRAELEKQAGQQAYTTAVTEDQSKKPYAEFKKENPTVVTSAELASPKPIATAVPDSVPAPSDVSKQQDTSTAVEKKQDFNMPNGATATKIKKANGTEVDGYILNGQTFNLDGSRIETGDQVTIGGKTFEMGADGKGFEVKPTATAVPDNIPKVEPKQEQNTPTAIEEQQPKEFRIPDGATITVITKPDGSQVDGYVLNGQTFYKDGTRIGTGDKVTINGRTYEMGADGKGIDLAQRAVDNFFTNPTAETWAEFNNANPDLSKLTPEQRAKVDSFRSDLLSTTEGIASEMKRTEDAAGERLNEGLDTASQDKYYQYLQDAFKKASDLEKIKNGELPSNQSQDQTGSMDQKTSSAYQQATSLVESANKTATDALQKQADSAMKLKELDDKAQKELFAQTVASLKDNAFLEQLKVGQGFANRGLLNSGMLTDALVRLNASTDQKINDTAAKQIANLAKSEQKYNTTLQTIRDKQQKIADGKEADIEKAFKSIQKDQQTAVKTSQDAFLDQAKLLYNTVKTLSGEGADTQKLNALFAEGFQNGSFADMIKYMGTQPMGLSTKGALDVAKADKVYADQTGMVYIGGKPLLDPKGNAVGTFDAKLAAQKIATQQAKIAQDSANIRAKIGTNLDATKLKVALEELKMEKKIGLEYDKLSQKAAEKHMESVLEMIKQGDKRYMSDMSTATSLADDSASRVAKESAFASATSWAATRNQLESVLNASKGEIEKLVNSYGGGNVDITPQNNSAFFSPNQAQSWLNNWKSSK